MGNTKTLHDRMKEYEAVTRTSLTRRVPVIVRVDGKAFKTFTKGFEKPFDKAFRDTMVDTMKFMCENIQGCVFGYTQSDEITLVLTDYETIKTEAWFDYDVRKMVSISASMATMQFNKMFAKNIPYVASPYTDKKDGWVKQAIFDSRVFSLPKDEVANCLIWRQLDAIRNSIETTGQTYFSHKQLYKLNQEEIKELLLKDAKVNWEDYNTDYKYGVSCYKVETEIKHVREDSGEEPIKTMTRKKWYVDHETPQFKDNRDFIEKYL